MTFTRRLRLEPIGPERADDPWRIHQDDVIAHWYGGRWSREHATEVAAFTEQHNHRSRAVMERLGMRHVGDLRRPGLVEGREGIHDGAPFVLYQA